MGINDIIYNNSKKFAVLIDPDKIAGKDVEAVSKSMQDNDVDIVFLGGSLLLEDHLNDTIDVIKKNCDKPIVIFPGSTMQVNPKADALLLLSLISGRNPEMLIGAHVIAAPYIKASGLEVIPTGYMLIDSGRPTTASYMSHSLPIPHDKNEIAACTALAGEMLGLKVIYLDGGSGAKENVSCEMISLVKKNIKVPLFIGGGIRTPEIASDIYKAGADLIVVGNAIQNKLALIEEISSIKHSL